MSSIRSGDLVRFIAGRSDEIEKLVFPENDGCTYLVLSEPKMKVFTVSPGERSHETLSVDIMFGASVRTVPINILERAEKAFRRATSDQSSKKCTPKRQEKLRESGESLEKESTAR